MHISDRIRNSYLIFPASFQPFITWLTGRALPGQKPLFLLNKWLILFFTLTIFFCGIAITVFSLHQVSVSYVGIFLGLSLTLAACRKMTLCFRHQFVHGQFVKKFTTNLLFAELITLITLAQSGQEYYKSHVLRHHKKEYLASIDDPDVKLLASFGFTPGKTQVQLWFLLIRSIFSPVFHFKFSYKKILSNFSHPKLYRKLLSVLFAAFWIVLIIFTPLTVIDFIIAYFFPVVILQNVSALLEIISEHPWLLPNKNNLNEKEYYSARCWAIHCGEMVPKYHASYFKFFALWVVWVLKHVFYHLPTRLFVITSDIAAHDLHHLLPGRYDWRIPVYERQKNIDQKNLNHESLQEIWGLIRVINHVFKLYSKLSLNEKL